MLGGVIKLIIFIGAVIGLAILFVKGALSYELTTFNDSTISKNITFTGNENQTVYIKLPKPSSMINAQLNLTGYNKTNTDWNFSVSSQEINPTGLYFNGTYFWATGLTSTNLDLYLANGSWNSTISSLNQITNPSCVYSNGTYIYVGNGNSNGNITAYFMNGTYSHVAVDTSVVGRTGGNSINPTGFVKNTTYSWVADWGNSRVWRFYNNGTFDPTGNWSLIGSGYYVDEIMYNETFFWIADTNQHVISRWFNNYTQDTRWYLNFNTQESGSHVGAVFNGTYFFVVGDSADRVFMYTEIPLYPKNPFLDTSEDGDKDWEYSGSFTQINNRTDNFSAEIQSYLDACTLESDGNCTVPLRFHSDTEGILQITDLNFTYSYTPTSLVSLVNSSISNFTTYQNQPFNLTVTGTSGNTLTYNLYNSSGLFSTGASLEKPVSISNPNLYQYIYNTSGNENYTSSTLSRFVTVFNVTAYTPEQVTTFSSLTENTTYDLVSKSRISFNNTGQTNQNVKYTYSIPSDFSSPSSLSLVNSSGSSITNTQSGNAVNWTSETTSPNIPKVMNLTWTCKDCINYSSVINSYNATEINKTLLVISNITSYTVNVGSIKVELPNIYIANDFNVSVKENGTEIANTDRVSKIQSGDYYDYLLINTITLSAKEYEVNVYEKKAPGGTVGESASAGGGGNPLEPEKGVLYSGNFSFTVDPNQIVTCSGFLCTTPKLTPYEPYNKFKASIRVCNYETRKENRFLLFPDYYWSCTKDNCMSSWCRVENRWNNTTGIEQRACGYLDIVCTIPPDAKTDLNKTLNDLQANIYYANFFVYPRYYSKNNAKQVGISIEVSSEPERKIEFSSIGLESLNLWQKIIAYISKPFICFSQECRNDSLIYKEISVKVMGRKLNSISYIGAVITLLVLITFIISGIYLIFVV